MSELVSSGPYLLLIVSANQVFFQSQPSGHVCLQSRVFKFIFGNWIFPIGFNSELRFSFSFDPTSLDLITAASRPFKNGIARFLGIRSFCRGKYFSKTLQPVRKSIKLKYDQLKLPIYTQQNVRHRRSVKLNFKVVFKYNQPLAYISILPRKPCWIIIMESFHLSFTTFWQFVTRKSKNLSSWITLPNPRTTSWSQLRFVTILTN